MWSGVVILPRGQNKDDHGGCAEEQRCNNDWVLPAAEAPNGAGLHHPFTTKGGKN
jgi:hypothetical protein